MPDPVSVTLTLKLPLSAFAVTRTTPVAVNLMALPTRLSSTWVRRCSSPRRLRGYVFAPRAARVQEPANAARPKAARPAVREATPASAEGEQGGAVGSASWSKAVAASCPHG